MSITGIAVCPSARYAYDLSVRAYPDAKLARGWPIIELHPSTVQSRAVPQDFYLWELLDLDSSSDEAVLDFVRAWGPCGPVLLDAPPPWQTELAQAENLTGNSFWFDVEGTYLWNREQKCVKGDITANLVDLRLTIAILRDVVRTILLDAGALSFENLVASWECSPSPPSDVQATVRWATSKLSNALQDFHPFVTVATVEPGSLGGATESSIDLVGACCLQLFNHLVTGTRYRLCSRCDRIFVVQRGRSAHGAHRLDELVRYCSARCASAAASQKHRQRRKQAAT